MNKILIINICREKLHFYEFVKPIKDILSRNNIKTLIKHYSSLTKKDLEKSTHIIICGTSLRDDDFINNLSKFSWIKDYNKPILGICGGMQIIGLIYDNKLKTKREIGFFNEEFNKEFLGLNNLDVYHLHNNYIDCSKSDEFINYSKNKITQAFKHKDKPFYGVLFHPEVRNKNLILNFINL